MQKNLYVTVDFRRLRNGAYLAGITVHRLSKEANYVKFNLFLLIQALVVMASQQ